MKIFLIARRFLKLVRFSSEGRDRLIRSPDMEQWLNRIRMMRRELDELEAYMAEGVACEKLVEAIFSDEPPKRRGRRRTTATPPLD
jgi:hypothetical protein